MTSLHAVKVCRRWRLAWAGTHKVARRADGSPLDRGGWPDEKPVSASMAARELNRVMNEQERDLAHATQSVNQ